MMLVIVDSDGLAHVPHREFTGNDNGGGYEYWGAKCLDRRFPRVHKRDELIAGVPTCIDCMLEAHKYPATFAARLLDP